MKPLNNKVFIEQAMLTMRASISAGDDLWPKKEIGAIMRHVGVRVRLFLQIDIGRS